MKRLGGLCVIVLAVLVFVGIEMQWAMQEQQDIELKGFVAASHVGAYTQQEREQKIQVWDGENGWTIAYTLAPANWNHSLQCVLTRIDDDQALFVTRDFFQSQLAFVGPAPPEMNAGILRNESSIVASVDGHVLLDTMTGLDAVHDIPPHGLMLIISERLLSWDDNNERDTGLETEQVFDLLRHGHTLTIKTYGQTYTEDLTGVGSALDLFPACLRYSLRQSP